MGTISRRSYFNGTAAALGGLLAAACDPFGSSRSAGEPGRRVPPLVHTHSAVLHLSAQSAHSDEAWSLLTLLLEPDTLYKFNNLRQSLPPRQSILGRGYLQDRKLQQIVALWLRYGRPSFNPPDYRAVARAINELFLEVVGWGKDPRRMVKECAG